MLEKYLWLFCIWNDLIEISLNQMCSLSVQRYCLAVKDLMFAEMDELEFGRNLFTFHIFASDIYRTQGPTPIIYVVSGSVECGCLWFSTNEDIMEW